MQEMQEQLERVVDEAKKLCSNGCIPHSTKENIRACAMHITDIAIENLTGTVLRKAFDVALAITEFINEVEDK